MSSTAAKSRYKYLTDSRERRLLVSAVSKLADYIKMEQFSAVVLLDTGARPLQRLLAETLKRRAPGFGGVKFYYINPDFALALSPEEKWRYLDYLLKRHKRLFSEKGPVLILDEISAVGLNANRTKRVLIEAGLENIKTAALYAEKDAKARLNFVARTVASVLALNSFIWRKNALLLGVEKHAFLPLSKRSNAGTASSELRRELSRLGRGKQKKQTRRIR